MLRGCGKTCLLEPVRAGQDICHRYSMCLSNYRRAVSNGTPINYRTTCMGYTYMVLQRGDEMVQKKSYTRANSTRKVQVRKYTLYPQRPLVRPAKFKSANTRVIPKDDLIDMNLHYSHCTQCRFTGPMVDERTMRAITSTDGPISSSQCR